MSYKRLTGQVAVVVLATWAAIISLLLYYQTDSKLISNKLEQFPSTINQASSSDKCHLIQRLETAPGVLYNITHCIPDNKVIITANMNRSASFTLRVVSERQLLTVETNGIDTNRFEMQFHACYQGYHKAYLRFIHDDAKFSLKDNCMLTTRNVTDRVVWMFERNIEYAPEDKECSEQWIWPTGYNQSTSPAHLDRYRDQDSPHSHQSNLTEYYAGLEYNYPFIDRERLGNCLVDRKICLLGDSHARNLMNALERLMNDSNVKVCVKGQLSCQTDFFIYHHMTYQHFFQERMTDGCTDLVANFGHWSVSWAETKNGGPWSADRYQEEVRVLFSRLADYADRKGVYWLTNNPAPINSFVKACPLYDYRFLFALREYNRRSLLLATEFAPRRLKAIDSTRLMFPMFDASYDSAHYLELVGTALARYVLTHICAK